MSVSRQDRAELSDKVLHIIGLCLVTARRVAIQ